MNFTPKLLINNATNLAAVKTLMKHAGVTIDVLLASTFVEQIAEETGLNEECVYGPERIERVLNTTDVEYFEGWMDKLSEDVAMLLFVGGEE